MLVPEADDSVPAAVLSAFFQKRQTKRDGMELVILEPVDIPTDKKGKRAATELETQIRCQMEAARLAVGREGA